MNLELLNEIDSFVWGPPLLVLLVGTGGILAGCEAAQSVRAYF